MIYYINISLIILEGIFLLIFGQKKIYKKVFCTLVSIQWILISGLRSLSIGEDTANYGVIFHNAINIPWSQLFESFKNYGVKDPGYPLFEKAIGMLTDNYQVYLFFVALIFTIPLGYFIYKNSVEPLFSFLIYSCLFYTFFSLTGIRQTIATALVVLVGYKFIKERKFLPFLVLMLVAFTIHKSAICFFPFYFIANKKITKDYLIIYMIISAGILLLGKYFYAPIAILMGYDDYMTYSNGGTGTFTLMIILISVMAIWRMKIILQNNPKSIFSLNAIIMALPITLMTLQNQSFMRAQQYYSLFIMLLIPEIIKSFPKKERIIIYYISVTLLLILFVRTNPRQYLFFWQE